MKNRLRILLVLSIVVLTSTFVPDTRIMTPPKNVLEEAAKEVKKHIQDTKWLVCIAPIPKVEEVEVSEEHLEEIAFSETSELQDYTEESEVVEEESGLVYIGTYEITAYEWTGNPCANGNYPSEGYTVACNDLPLGTTVYIDGVGYRVVEDRGGGGYGWMDIYLGDVGACYEWGRQYREVWVVE